MVHLTCSILLIWVNGMEQQLISVNKQYMSHLVLDLLEEIRPFGTQEIIPCTKFILGSQLPDSLNITFTQQIIS